MFEVEIKFNGVTMCVKNHIPTLKELIISEEEAQEKEKELEFEENELYVEYLNFLKLSQMIEISEK